MMAYNYPTYPGMGYQNPAVPQQSFARSMPTPNITLIPVHGKDVVDAWAVAPGATAYFIDLSAPYLYTKSAGYPPLGQITTKTYLLKEETPQKASETPQSDVSSAEEEDTIKEIKSEIAALWQAVGERKSKGEVKDEPVSE